MKDTGKDRPATGVRALTTAIRVLRTLDFIASLPDPQRLSEICAALGMQRGTVYQQLKTLIDAGWVEVRDDGRYQLSLRSVSVGEMALRQMNLGDRVEPILERLVQETNETASITMMQAGQPVIIQRVEVDRAIVARQKIGARLDLATSASGKVHIVFNDPKALCEIERLSQQPLKNSEIAEVRRARLAFSEPGTGLLAAATPIFNASGACVAALSLVGLEHQNEILRAGRHLLQAAEEISKLFST